MTPKISKSLWCGLKTAKTCATSKPAQRKSAAGATCTDGAYRAPVATKLYGYAGKNERPSFEVEAQEPEGGKRITARLREYSLIEALTPNENGTILPVYVQVNFDLDYPYSKVDWTEVRTDADDDLFGVSEPRRFVEAAICATPKLTLI